MDQKEDKKQHLLFVCTGNLDRSPTAASLFARHSFYEAKSAGTSILAIARVSQELIDWADIIFVMSEQEDGHLSYLQKHFNLSGKKIYDLDIIDRFGRNNPELVSLLREKLNAYGIEI